MNPIKHAYTFGRIQTARMIGLCLLLALPSPAVAEADWAALTWDNDMLLLSDDGYTNGWYASWFETDMEKSRLVKPSFFVAPLSWSLPANRKPLFRINAHTIGQAMVTPRDITARNPNPDDLPYTGLFFYNNSHFRVYDNYADKIGTLIGIVGPASGAEHTQKLIHRLLDSDEPRGWDHQLRNEPVFRLSRSRIWRAWSSGSGLGNSDLLVSAEANLGNLETSLAGGVMWRYGRELAQTYVTPAFHSSRASNPLSIDGGWYYYLGLSARYLFNYIFIDGNTFRDSRSADLDHSQIGLMTGFTHSWRDWALTFSVEDMDIFENQLEGAARFASLTVAWRLD